MFVQLQSDQQIQIYHMLEKEMKFFPKELRELKVKNAWQSF